jgi:sugar lactone lactonase YvrE
MRTASSLRHLIFLALALAGTSRHAEAQFVTNQAADRVLGWNSFTDSGDPLAATGYGVPASVAVDPNTGKVFVSDSNKHRILRYPANPASGTPPEAVFGQADLDGIQPNRGNPSPSADSFNAPTGIFVDTVGTLWVADTANHRVLAFFSAFATPSEIPDVFEADIVIGQPDFVTATAGTSSTTMNRPVDLHVDYPNKRLWVADRQNLRVVRFDNVYAPGPAAGEADGVLGQPDLDSSVSGSTGPHYFNPTAICLDPSGTLWVGDSGNNRILGFLSPETLPADEFSDADRVLGQPDFTSSGGDPSARRFNYPASLRCLPDGSLFVLDSLRRVLLFPASALGANFPAASLVLGQPNFDATESGRTPRRFDGPSGLGLDSDGNLWVTDPGSLRVLRFQRPDTARPSVRINGRKRLTVRTRRVLVRGSAADDRRLAGVFVSATRSPARRASGTSSWRMTVTLKSRRTLVRAEARDHAGNRSAPASIAVQRR